MTTVLLLQAMLSFVVGQRANQRSRVAAAVLVLTSAVRVQCLASPSLLKRPFAVSSLSVRHQTNNGGSPSLFLDPAETLLRGGQLFSTQKRTPTTRTTSTSLLSTTTAASDEATTTNMALSASEKLEALRRRMKDENVDVLLVPSDDPHLSEYTPDAYKRRGFISNFHGSAGTAVVTADEALLWTDSRYWNEANLQLDGDCWTLQKQGLPATPTIPKWLASLAAKQYSKNDKKPLQIGIDPYVHPASFPKDLETALAEAARDELSVADDDEGDEADMQDDEDEEDVTIGELKTLGSNLVDDVWAADRPSVPLSPFRVHPLKYAGKTLAEKVALVRAEMETKKVSLAVFCTLDDVAYLFNMRAKGDVDTCPVGIAYATISKDNVNLYCDPAKVSSAAVQEHLKELVTVKGYDEITTDIEAHCQVSKKNRVWLDKSRANFAISNVIPNKALLDAQNAIVPMKARKNEAELEGMRQAHIVDGAAMAEFMAWLEETIVKKGETVSEVEIDEKLTGFRAQQPGFIEVSFPTIAGVGSNGAIIHYSAKEGTDLLKYLDKDTPILIDSGGQYEYGTTDVTRTWHFGQATPEFIDMYTRVLKGNIGMDVMIFPENTPGFVLDVYARRWLWDAGRDYGHGTGHGVGASLNVHEGPISVSPRWGNKEVLKQGMVLSNEPGFYADGEFGIRIENLLEILWVKPEHNEEQPNGDGEPSSSEKKFMKFAKLTMIPIQKNLIDLSLMTKEELDWLDEYHEEVLAKVSPLLEADSPAMAWLKKSCEKIERP